MRRLIFLPLLAFVAWSCEQVTQPDPEDQAPAIQLDELATGATLLVPEQYATIQACINAASSGDVCSVAAGTYTDGPVALPPLNTASVLLNKAITLKSRELYQATIDGQAPTGNHAVIAVTSDGAHIEGFVLRNARFGIHQTNTSHSSDHWTARNIILTDVGQGITINDYATRRGRASLSNIWVGPCRPGGHGFNTNDADRIEIRNAVVTNCTIGFVGHNHNSFTVDYSLLFNVEIDRHGSSSGYLPSFGSHVFTADPQSFTVDLGSRLLPRFLACASPAVDAGDPSALFNDAQIPPSLGTIVNDIGAYGGPGALLTLSPAEETSLLKQAGCLIEVEIDIKPGSDPNCFNNNGHGVIPVAILGSATFDVTQVDAATVELQGLSIAARGKSNKLLAHIENVNGDEFDDMVVQIEDVDGVFTSGSGTATLTGNLLDGSAFEGEDDICIVP